MSTVDFRGCRYLACVVGITSNANGTISTQPIKDEDPDQHRAEFNTCELATVLDFNSHCIVFDAAYIDNLIDLTLDGEAKPIIPVDHTSGIYGIKFSTFIYNDIITS